MTIENRIFSIAFKELTFKNSKGKIAKTLSDQTNTLSESLILAQDERWRRA